MAETKRRRPVQKEPSMTLEEIVPAEANVVEEIPVKKDILSSDHLRQLETMDRDVHIAKLSMAVEEQSLKNLLLENQLLVGKVEKQKILLMEKAKQYENSKAMFTSFKKELWPQYGLVEASGLGYDPNTGKIISSN